MLKTSNSVALHKKQWDFLKNKFKTGKMPHAFLFSGPKESEKNLFAKELVKFISCSEKEKPCQICQNCRMIEKENFPDLLVVKSINSESSIKNEKDMMVIEIEQIRQAQNFLALKSYYGGYKFLIVDDAERMTFEAQSCFLKTLEEPRGKTIIFLISSKPHMILQTIYSRCQEIKFFYREHYEFSDQEQKILSDLGKVMGSELAEKFQYAKNTNLEGENFNKILGVLRKHLRHLLLAKAGVEKAENVNYPMSKIKKAIELIEDISRQAEISNINNKMALEVILMEI